MQDDRLLATFEVARILVSETDLDAMLPRFLSSLIETLDAADAGALWLYDLSAGRLVVKGCHGYHAASFRRLRLAPGEAMAGHVFESGKAELYATPEASATAMNNMSPGNHDLFQEATAGLGRPQSAIGVPLVGGPTPLGVLILVNLGQPAGFTPEDLAFVERVAGLVTVAIENAHLRDQLRSVQTMSEANRLKSELISTLAHEMRTPLTSIKGYASALLLEEASFGPELQREFLEIIDQECDVLQDLIHDLLESSIIDAGLLKLEPQPIRLPLLAQDVTDDMARRSPKHRFFVDFPQSFPIVDADPDRVAQVLRNLLDNAVKYSPEGGLIVVRGEAREGEVVVSVADQGVGIAPEHLNRLFEKFFRARSLLDRHVVGSGLGLPICRTIVEGHGGRIWAESRVGQGSTFYFTLPQPAASPDPQEPKGTQDE